MRSDSGEITEIAMNYLRQIGLIPLGSALIGFFLIVSLIGIGWPVALLLSVGIYVGVKLVVPQQLPPEPPPPPPPPSPEQLAFEACRQVAANIRQSNLALLDREDQASVTSIVDQVTRQLDAIEEDAEEEGEPERLLAAMPYYDKFLKLFDEIFRRHLKLLRREIELPGGGAAFKRLLSRFERAANEFYQEYHLSDLLDLATLTEILENNLGDFDEDEDDYLDPNIGDDDHPDNDPPSPGRESGPGELGQGGSSSTSRKNLTKRSVIFRDHRKSGDDA